MEKVIISRADNGFVVERFWGRGAGAGSNIEIAQSPMDLAKIVCGSFYDDKYEEPYILEKVPERLEYKVREFIRNNPE